MDLKQLNIGDIIRDVEDGDCYYEGVVTCLNPIRYKITKILWSGQLDNSMNGEILELKWWILEKLENQKWIIIC